MGFAGDESDAFRHVSATLVLSMRGLSWPVPSDTSPRVRVLGVACEGTGMCQVVCEFIYLKSFVVFGRLWYMRNRGILRFRPMSVPEKSPVPLPYAELAKLTDEALMLQLQRGQHNALAVLFDRYHRLVTTIASRILRDAGEAEDLMQAVFLEVFRSSAQFDPAKGTTKVWLLQYAYHRSFNRRHYLSLRGLYEHSSNAEGEAEPLLARNAQSHSAMESSHLVKEALGSLNGAQRKVLELAFYEGLTMKEIAEKTGDSFDSVRHNYYRGLEKLRTLLCCKRDAGLDPSSPGERVPHAKP
jgi:RNA polymerase sigma-70 factor (ECF subfamily)